MAPERDLFANFERMRREIDELFGDVFGRAAPAPHRRAGFTPAVDVAVADAPPRVLVTVALPGVRLEELELDIQGRELIIAGLRRPADAGAGSYQQVEIERGRFRRSVSLPADVLAEETRATYEDGMLRVELPIAPPAAESRRSVPIEAGRRRPPEQR